MTPFPCFIDLEASGFSRGSYPLSVAWNDPHGTIDKVLINPDAVPAWTEWDADAEAVHGLSRAQLRREGLGVVPVADLLTARLQTNAVYSDAPDYDARWLDRLFEAAGRPRTFTLHHVDDLFLPLVLREGEFQWQGVARLEGIKERIRSLVPGHHDAGYDVGYLIQVWRAAQGKAVKMGHGLGALPEITATGSFVRVKPG